MTTARRNREFWKRAVREVEGGAAVSAVARRLGVRPGTLSWWRWHLGNEPETRASERERRARIAKAELATKQLKLAARPTPARTHDAKPQQLREAA